MELVLRREALVPMAALPDELVDYLEAWAGEVDARALIERLSAMGSRPTERWNRNAEGYDAPDPVNVLNQVVEAVRQQERLSGGAVTKSTLDSAEAMASLRPAIIWLMAAEQAAGDEADVGLVARFVTQSQ